jgi:hypothetical protein
MPRHVVAGFRPSRNGFHFSNSFPRAPVIHVRLPGLPWKFGFGNASGGLCGGMIYAVRDLFESGRLPPRDTESPPADSHSFRWIARRLMQSFGLPLGPLRYYAWMAMPDRGNSLVPGILRGTLREWRKIKAELEAGRLVALGLILTYSWDPRRVGENHQVLAYGYETTDRTASLLIYDPNCPDNDEVKLTVDLTGRAPLEYTQCPVRGFFRTRYSPCPVPGHLAD